MRKLNYVITAEYSSRPLLHFLRGGAKLSTRIVATLRHTENSVLVNGIPARLIDKVRAGDAVTVLLPEKSEPPQLFEMELEIIYEDDDLLVVNKPSGISVHPTYNHPNGTLSNAVANYLIKNGGTPSAARAVGRLDKVTSGVIIFAKHSVAASLLNGELDKTYYAIVHGILNGSGTVNAPIYRPDSTKTLRAVGEGGDEAVTHWQAVESCGDLTLVRIKTETGRTHQIRVHLAYIGHPLAGDEMYGGTCVGSINRAALHCAEISITHPVTKEVLTFEAPMPEDMQSFNKPQKNS